VHRQLVRWLEQLGHRTGLPDRIAISEADGRQNAGMGR
jgi:hypothetical protein